MFVLFSLVIAGLNGRAFVNPVICGLGKISFSGYMSHFFIVDLVALYFPLDEMCGFSEFSVTLYVLVFIFIAVLVTALFSTVTYKYIERPGIALGNTIIGALERRPRV